MVEWVFQAFFANAFDENLDTRYLAGKRLAQLVGVDGKAVRRQAVDGAAPAAAEMRVTDMVFVGRQSVMGGPCTVDPLDDTMLHEQVENTVDGDPVDRLRPFNGLKDVGSSEGGAVAADHLDDPQSVFRHLET